MRESIPIAAAATLLSLAVSVSPSAVSAQAAHVKESVGIEFQATQFAVYSATSGPRGQRRATGPGAWMLMGSHALSATNSLRITLMLTPEQFSVGQRGTPQLLQTENLDAMHPHDYITALELTDVIKLGARGNHELTLLFAPRGRAAIGPVPFMHRESAEGNPDAPLGHAIQDGFHDVSTVLGVGYRNAGTAVEVTAFSSHDLIWPLPLHQSNSYSLRLTQNINRHITIGTSYGDVFAAADPGGARREKFTTGWLATSHSRGGDTLKSSLIWGHVRAGQEAARSSVLAEAIYQRGADRVFARGEALQIPSVQLDVQSLDRAPDTNWFEAVTVGYQRAVMEARQIALFVGGSYTRDFISSAFNRDYGETPSGGKLFFRLKVTLPEKMKHEM